MRTSIAGLVVLLFLGAPALAHHGLAAFDQTTKVTVKGTVTAFRFVNPHAVVEFDVKDDAGQVQGWQAELTTPNRLKGWTATSLEPGVVVTVTGYRAKSGAPSLWVTALTASNGLELKVSAKPPSVSSRRYGETRPAFSVGRRTWRCPCQTRRLSGQAGARFSQDC
jgi:Family of unknown function (DUF6152)